jgi:hypothetical protein
MLIEEIPPDVIPTQVADEVNRRSTVNATTHLSKSMKRKPSFSVEADRFNRETRQKRNKRDDISQNDEGQGDDQYNNGGAATGNRGSGKRRKHEKWSPLDDARLLAWQQENKSLKWITKQLQGVRSSGAISGRLRELNLMEDQMWFDVEKVLDSKMEGGIKKFLVRWRDSWVEDIDPELIRRFEEGD